MKHPYDISYEPTFPTITVAFQNVEVGRQTEPISALLDTGSDGTLVPIGLLRQILASPLTTTRIRSHWGEWRSVQLFAVDVKIDHLTLPGIFVVGDEQGDEVILGRDVLNRLRLLLDGPAQMTDVYTR
jgi:predicted aspartyl protease